MVVVVDWVLRCKNHPTERIMDLLGDVNDVDWRVLKLFAKAIVKCQGVTPGEDDTYEGYEELNAEDLPPSLAEPLPKDKHLKVKQFLTFIGPTAILKTDVEPRRYDKLSAKGLAVYIKDCAQKIEFQHYKALSLYMNMGTALEALMFELQHKDGKKVLSKAKCYPVIHELTGVAKSTYFSYMSFVRFIQDYPRFIHTSLSFNQIKLNQASIRDWFAAQDLRLE
ncbi:hypothetical protein BJ741DRAFT_587092 [Chytriomyces cf. hyalinus JEL632]|nr:hypothetical protein BJ741DRAFT_587092 [Chytriomyces cf. hyalinus JEL632]